MGPAVTTTSLDVAAPLAPARLVGASSSPSSIGSTTGGPLLEAEGSWAVALAQGADPARSGWALGVRAGWSLPNGISAHLRYDDVAIRLPGATTALQVASCGVRYSVPFLVPLPFAEVDAGPAFVDGQVRVGVGAALGLSIPIGRHVLLDVFGRDWLVTLGTSLQQVLGGGVGLGVMFAPPS
jgi:hypothetical protein